MAATVISPSPSSLQVAQILADLHTLQNADPTAAHALLSANKSISPLLVREKSQAAIAPEPYKFDSLGKRVVPPASAGNHTPPTHTPSLSRMDSTTSSGYLSGTGTPVPGASAVEMDEDMKRAKTLLELFEMRGKFKEMGDTGLTRSKARVDQAVAKYAEMELAERERNVRARHSGV